MAMLRDEENGCPWDRKQTFKTITPHTLEEVYEVIDTIERKDFDHLANELGDLLFQVIFYAQLGSESGLFDFNDIVTEIGNKLLQRHPHVFPAATIESFGVNKEITPEQVENSWEKIKNAERKVKASEDTSVLADIPLAFPAIIRARKIQKRAANAGFDWPDYNGVLDKIEEEIQELKEALTGQSQSAREEELGDLFFSLVNLSRHLQIDAESAVRKANAKFELRFRALEDMVEESGQPIETFSLEKLEQCWQDVKKNFR